MAEKITSADLSQVDLFRGFDESEFADLLSVLQVRELAAGAVLFQAGSDTRNLFVLLSGSAKITLESEAREETLLAEVSAGEVFGEATFFHAVPHTASAVCTSEVRVAVLDRSDFDELIKRRVLAAFHLAANAAEILSARLHHADEMIRNILETEQSAHLHDLRRHYFQSFRHKLVMPRGYYS